jgi:hypothetical protein
MNTTEILDKAKKLVSEDRNQKHGDKVFNHENIARLWTAYLQNKFKLKVVVLPEDVANLMVLLKVARTQEGEHNEDDYVDAVGYSAIAGEIASKRQQLSTTLGVINEKQAETTTDK